ncbi:NADAR domain-containing protein [Caenorhabditis elegans]|uniref:NADAR domain-containing protein n=1 Tax=Caenorhabditis elegans TaxID=6239 RepID=G5EFJ3_CAEEL|nr:NADAR domain-containing protein [Caenorhabditis elegans]CAB03858.2 NADAR domain-containing protein [Caenorhabditis elegans]|eukprot:NP_507592.2 Uncharacterized protein CELE_C08E8.4 [Caenorhabditis elegans]
MHTRILNAKNQQTYVLFYEDESVFSNFHPSNFEAETAKKLVNSGMFKEEEMLKFNCSEQYFMYHKALLVGDVDSAKVIITAKHPMVMKMTGRQLNMNRHDIDNWTQKSRDIMYLACLAKFSQNVELRKMLFRTQDMYLVEASGNDAIWGNGIWKEDKRSDDVANWHGTNYLGEILDRIRGELIGKPEFAAEKEAVQLESLEQRIQMLMA